jgi:hypothetical protein
MPLILDTWNILHVTGILPPELAGIDLPGLAELIGRSRYAGERVLLVCDGGKPGAGGPTPLPAGGRGCPRDGGPEAGDDPDLPAGMDVRYSGPRRTADELIIALVERSTAPRLITVVTSDRVIQRAARRRRSRTMDSPEFLRQLSADAAGPPGAAATDPRPRGRLSTEQVSDWIDVFGIDGTPLDETLDVELPAELAGKLARERPAPPPPSSDAPRPIMRRAPAEGPTLPPDIIDQAERLWGEEEET